MPIWCFFSDGVETHFAVNHLGHFLLTYLLLDKIKATATSRIVYLMNLSYRKAELNLSDPNFTTRVFDKSEAFNQSQLANMLTIRYALIQNPYSSIIQTTTLIGIYR